MEIFLKKKLKILVPPLAVLFWVEDHLNPNVLDDLLVILGS